MRAYQEREQPKLRKIDSISVNRDGQTMIVLRDPLCLCEPVAIDQEFLPVLSLMDGTRSTAQIRQSLLMRLGLDIDIEDLYQFVSDIGEHGLLEGETFRNLWASTHERFVNDSHRDAMWADILYPKDVSQLEGILESAIPLRQDRFSASDPIVGLVCPYQPFELSAEVYRSALRTLPPAEQLDAILILGTDHVSGMTPYALINKPFTTSLGTVGTAKLILERLIQRLPWITREEIRHRSAVSIEMAVLLLQYLYGRKCPPIIPVLCSQNVANLSANEHGAEIDHFLAEGELIRQRHRLLIWASAELSHVGPAYGTMEPDTATRIRIAEDDQNCLSALAQGRQRLFMERCMARSIELGRPSGTATLATLMQLLPVGYRASIDAYSVQQNHDDEPGQMGLTSMRFWSPRNR